MTEHVKVVVTYVLRTLIYPQQFASDVLKTILNDGCQRSDGKVCYGCQGK